MGNKLGKAHITQQSDYLAGGHVNYKTGALQQQAKEAGCLGRLFQDLGCGKNQIYTKMWRIQYEFYQKISQNHHHDHRQHFVEFQVRVN